MSDKIAQHKHCRGCGKAFVGSDKFCSEECRTSSGTNLQKKKRQLLILYVATFVILILALVVTMG
jgi:predicted nucleic acid-binding Zn ribbon protein